MPTTSTERKARLREGVLRGFLAGFRRSSRGSLWREYDGARFVVYSSARGGYGTLVVEGDEKEFSEGKFDNEAEALASLAELVERAMERNPGHGEQAG